MLEKVDALLLLGSIVSAQVVAAAIALLLFIRDVILMPFDE